MGWLKEYGDDDGPVRYYAVYRDLQGRERSAGSSTSKRAANKAWQDAESRQNRGYVGDPKRGRMLFEKYVTEEWFPNHQIEASTREGYTYLLNRYIVPHFGKMKMRDIMPSHVREWILQLQAGGTRPPTIKTCKLVLSAILTTALNDQITTLHAGKGVKTPAVARKPKRIITAEQFEKIYEAISDRTLRLLVETDIESGLRWGELTELRVKDLDQPTGMLTISRVVVHLTAKETPDDRRFLVKDYPKDGDWRQVKLAQHITAKLVAHIAAHRLGPDDLLFRMPELGPVRRRRPEGLPDPRTLGLTDENERGLRYSHGTLSAYQAGRCRCQYCRDAVSTYRAGRRAAGKDAPRRPRAPRTDGHISNNWFRGQVWLKAVNEAELGFHITPHGLRHAHASWLLAGGADLQVVKERLGHGSITTTEQYLHTLPGAHDAALSALEAIRGQKNDRAVPPAPGKNANQEITELRSAVAQLTDLLAALSRAV